MYQLGGVTGRPSLEKKHGASTTPECHSRHTPWNDNHFYMLYPDYYCLIY